MTDIKIPNLVIDILQDDKNQWYDRPILVNNKLMSSKDYTGKITKCYQLQTITPIYPLQSLINTLTNKKSKFSFDIDLGIEDILASDNPDNLKYCKKIPIDELTWKFWSHIMNNNVLLRYVITHAIDINVKTKCDKWYLINMYFNYNTDVDTMKFLLDHGADINSQCDSDGWTVLHQAAMRRSTNKKLIKLLLDRGADLTLTNHDNQTCMEAIKEYCSSDIIEYAKKFNNRNQ